MQSKRQLGLYYEEKARIFLCNKGLAFVTRNSVSRLGEIDLIMQDHSCLVLVSISIVCCWIQL